MSAIVRIGTSALTRDLVWCQCGRGLSLSGNWLYCPSCGRQIDQQSYASAVEQAYANGARPYRDPELVAELLVKQKRIAQLEQTGTPCRDGAHHPEPLCAICKAFMIELLDKRIRAMFTVAREESSGEDNDDFSEVGLMQSHAFHLLEIKNILNGKRTSGVYDDYGDPPTVHGPLFGDSK
jgi:hypothetical protein